MDPYEGVPLVHDNDLVALRIGRTPEATTITLEMREHLTGKPVSVSFPDVAWLSANLLGWIVRGEPTIDYIRRLAEDEIPPQYAHAGGNGYEIGLIAGSSVRLLSAQPGVH